MYGVVFVKFCHFKSVSLAAVVGIASISGCTGSSEPEATPTDELTQFLDDNPELKEPKDDAPASDPKNP
ncbi:hypothetical protein CEE69_10590 [Rhodopirellula bahusiensis]|uniref:Uncharacterized protein n=1 Tax=Rhodopirellula bahusiensis TaxID=2014065 RepID=A0A2G1W9E0_9BACT|nr:hypothetical protein CEE69_10590 [Rhodopirellula bahusiensis]